MKTLQKKTFNGDLVLEIGTYLYSYTLKVVSLLM